MVLIEDESQPRIDQEQLKGEMFVQSASSLAAAIIEEGNRPHVAVVAPIASSMAALVPDNPQEPKEEV